MKKKVKKMAEMPVEELSNLKPDEEVVLIDQAPLDKLSESDGMVLSNLLLQENNILLQLENLKIKLELIQARSVEFQNMLSQKYNLKKGDKLEKDFTIVRASVEDLENKP